MRKIDQSGQISIEFLISIVFVLAILLFGVFIFQNRTTVNQNLSQKWEADNVAHRVARNINNVYLMDNNSTYQESFYWQDSNRNVTVSEHSVLVWYNSGAFSDSPINAKLEWDITDVNGLLVFEKINDKVVVRYG